MPDLVKKWKEKHPYLQALEEEIQADEVRKWYQEEQQRQEEERRREESATVTPDWRERDAERGLTPPVPSGGNGHTADLEAEFQRRNGRGNRLTPFQEYMRATVASMPEQEETRSTDELRRDMNRQNRLARATNRMAADMGNQLLRDQRGIYDPVRSTNLGVMARTMEAQQEKADRATELYRTESTRRRWQEEQKKYASLLSNPDFAAKSGADETIGRNLTAASPAERLYRTITKRSNDKSNAKDRQAAEFVTDEEASIFYYLWNTQGARAAKAYYDDYVHNRASERRAVEAQRQAYEFGRNDMLGASAESVVGNVASGVGLLDMAWQNLARSIGITDPNKPLNYYSAAQLPSLVSDSIRSGVADQLAEYFPKLSIGKAENATNVVSFLYQTGMSMADSGVSILLNMVGIPEAATLANMGAIAGTRAIRDAKERGATDGQALAFGISSAIMEGLFEKISLDKILEPSTATKFWPRVKNAIDQMFTEGSEEVMTTLANTAMDQLIMGDKSELFTRQRRLMEQGVSEKEALRAAMLQWGTEVLGDLLGGMISGLGMGGTKEIATGLRYAARDAQTAREMTDVQNREAAQAREQALRTAYEQTQNRETAEPVQPRQQTAREQNPLQYALDKAANGETLTKNDARAILEDEQAMQTLRDAGVLTEDVRNDSEGRAQILQAVEALAEQNRAETVQATEELSQAPAENVQKVIEQAEEAAPAQERTGPPLPSGMQQNTETRTETRTETSPEPAQERTGPPLPSRMTQEQETRAETPAAQERTQGASEGLRLPSRAEAAESKPTTRANLTIGAAQERSGNLWTAQRTRENAPMLEAIRTANEDLLSSYMTAETQGDSDTAVIDAVNAVWQNVKQGDISPMAGAELLNKMWAAGKDDAARNMFLKSIIDNDGNLRAAALNAARSIDAEHRNGGLRIGQQTDIAAETTAAAAEEAAAKEAGNDLDYGGRGRVSGQRAGEQAGRVAGGKQALTQPGKAIGRRADAKNLRAEEVNARERIPAAAEGSTLKIVPEQMVRNDKELRAVAKRLEAITGKKVYYTIGNIRYRGEDGKISNARGAITEDGIYLRCDHNDLTVTQIGAHELYHYYEQQFPGLSARMKEKIIERYSAEEFNKVAQVYIEKLGGICGLTENMDAQAREEAMARVEAEIFADAFGNINYFGSGVTKFTDLVRGEVNATAGTENAAATQRKTGPPTQFSDDETNETRFSTDEEEYIPDNAAEYSRERTLEENRVPESAAEYARMKERARAREAELRRLEKKGKATAEERREAAELRKKLQPPKAKVQKQQATIAKKDLRNTLISQFSVPDGRKAEIGKMIDAYADRLIRDKRLTEADRRELFDKLYSEGVMTVPADDIYQAARELVRGGKIYVPESVKHEFGDDWNSFRTDAFREGIFLTNNPEDKGADSWNVELASEFPGLFPEDNYDQRDILERIVSAAQAGRDEKMSLAEYAANVVGQEYVSEDDLLDNMERQLDWALRTFADKAGLETWLRDKSEEKLAKQREKFGERLDAVKAQEIARRAKEREKRKEAARKQTEQKQLREMQQRTLKQLQWLSRNRQKFSGDMKSRLDEILSDIDVYAVSAANEAHLDKASNKTWRELADIYKDARENDPNFLPSEDLKHIVERLDNRKIGDMDIDAVTDLYKAAVGLRTELYNRNNVIGSELHETFQEVYDQVKDEMQKAKGGYQSGVKGFVQRYFSDPQLTPMNRMERMVGWNKDSAWYKMAKQLEQGERAQRKFKTDSARMLAPFLEEHKEWVKKADGQGKDAIWYEVEVPELLELGMGDKPIFGNTVKVYMTPAQKVHMYLESQNYDNLRHMTGGRTFADKELYSKGEREEAFAQGKTIRLAPETVKNLVKDLTPEEKALADALRPFYNEFSKKEINRVSNLLLGYDKAMEGDYAPIYTNKNYTKSEPGIFDTTAEGVGNLKSRVYSSNPSLNISALDAFEKSVDRTSRYVGLAVPVRNMNTLMNWREKGNSMPDVLTHKWGEDGMRFVNDLLTELQSGRETEQSSIEKLTNAALSRYISAVFGANPSIVTKQFASYPLAAAYLGWDNMPLNIPKAAKVDTDLIAKYTGEYDYRQLGYAMPETATLKDNPGKLQERGPLNFIFGGGAITWMDGFTVRTLWTWAENKVNKEQPGLEKGSQADIDAGNSEYYKAVAAEFEEALSRSQPMYDVMHRSNIMRESNPITRAFTLFKTVPMQEHNMLRQAIGEAQYAKESGASKEEQAEARQKAGRAFTGILAGNLMIGAITMLNALWKNRGKKYRDENGELNAEKLIAEAGKQYFKDAAGLMIGGDIVADVLSAILFGDKWYGLETPGMEQIESILAQTVKAGLTVQSLVRDSIEVLANGGDWARYMADHSEKYLNAVDGVMRTLGTYATGLPIDNVKAYLLGAVQWMSPEIKTAYEDAMSKADRSGLKGLSGASLEIRTANILKDRMGGADEETVEALAGLYEAGYRDAIPAAQVTSITVNGEDRTLNLAQQQTYADTWRDVVEGSLDDLVSSQTFRDADEKTQAKMLSKLYDLAKSKAAGAVFDDYKESSGLDKAEAAEDAGIDLADYVAIYAKYNEIANDDSLSSYEKGKQQRDLVESMSASDDAKMALYSVLNSTATSRIAKFETLLDADLSFADVMKIYDKYASLDSRDDMKAGDKAKDFILWVDTQKYTGKQKKLIKDTLKYFSQIPAEAERYEKLTDAGLDANTAYNVDKAISALKPEEGKNDVSALQKWQAAIKTVNGEANQRKALQALMTEEQYEKFKTASDVGISPSIYVQYKAGTKDITGDKDKNGETISGSLKKNVIEYIDTLPLTSEQKTTLLLDYNKTYSAKGVTWHSSGGGKSGGDKAKGGGKGSGSYAPARLKIQKQPWEVRPSSGLRITARPQQEAARPSGLRITARAK